MTHIKKILSYLQNKFSGSLDALVQARQAQVNAYLARSYDLADLERRMREIERNGISQTYRW